MASILPDDIRDVGNADPKVIASVTYEYVRYMREQMEFWASNRSKDIEELKMRVAALEGEGE